MSLLRWTRDVRRALPGRRVPRTSFAVVPCGEPGGGDEGEAKQQQKRLKPASEGDSPFNRLPTAVFAELVQYKTIPERFRMAENVSNLCRKNVQILTQCPSAKDYTELQLNDQGKKAVWFHAMFDLGSSPHIRDLSREKFNTTTKAALPQGTSDSAIEQFVQMCPHLTDLDLGVCTQITNAGLGALERCHELVKLDLTDCQQSTKTDIGGLVAMAKGCPHLTDLNLSGWTHITCDGLRALGAQCPALTKLDLSCGASIGDDHLAALGGRCPHLTQLELKKCTLITHAGLALLGAGCLRLTHLDLTKCKKITELGLLGEACPNLTYLDLTSCTQITDTGLRALGEKCKNLTHLVLNGCAQITDAGLEALKGCKNLTRLSLWGCVKITFGGCRNLIEAIPAIRIGG